MEAIARERYEFMRAGRSYLEWRVMTRWQRHDFMRRHHEEVKTRTQEAQKGWKELLGAVVGRLLGV